MCARTCTLLLHAAPCLSAIASFHPPLLQADADAAQKQAARQAGERDGEAERAGKEAARARRLEEQLQDAQQRLERLRQQNISPASADQELQVRFSGWVVGSSRSSCATRSSTWSGCARRTSRVLVLIRSCR